MHDDLRSKFAGCLLGLAIGDSLGADLEGHPGDELIRAYLEGRYNTDRLALSMWTDDTALAVATAQSILDSGCVNGADLAAKYLVWFEGGGRGIGRATLHAMRRLQKGASWDEAGETGEFAAGNGVAMRIAPVGLYHSRRATGLEEDVRTCGIVTHRNEEALLGGECVAYAVARATQDDFDPEVLGIELLSRLKPSRCQDSIERAFDAWHAGTELIGALQSIGLGGSAFETVASALYCFLVAPEDLERTLLLAVLAGGDADTRGAIAGAISGAYLGVEAIPSHWLSQLAGAQTITDLGYRLADVAPGEE